MSISSLLLGALSPPSITAWVSAILPSAPAQDTVQTPSVAEANVVAQEHVEPPAEPHDYYVPSRSYSTRPIALPPPYVKNLAETDIKAFEDLDWIEAGLDFRLRFENRENDFRRPVEATDRPFLYRTRFYFGILEKLDPFRFGFELEDARWSNSQFAGTTGEENYFEPIQAWVELYFDDALGKERPFSIRAGRMHFEFTDRRLIGSNEWRNTTNTFQGLRATLGQESNDWQVDVLALHPINREISQLDDSLDDEWFFGPIASWRRWSEYITLQPFYLGLNQDPDTSGANNTVHTAGLRAYGPAGKVGVDYDTSGVYQFGNAGGRDQNAFATIFELGYTFDHPWKPRVAGFYGYVSGDRDPNDDQNERFNRLYGFARPWSSNDYFQEENLSTPKLLLEFRPFEDTRIDTAYVGFWLASPTDRWNPAGVRDPTGESGDFVGQEFNIRVRQQITKTFELNVGYAFFRPGEFARNLKWPDDSHFFYVQLAISAF